MTVFYLIRHGHNDYVKKGKLAGRLTGVHLSEHGRAQAAALAKYLSKIRLSAVYTSPLERTMETAEPLAKAQGLDMIKRNGLLEIGYGTWQGQSLKSLRRRKLWPIIQSKPSLVRFPDGESFAEAQARIVSQLEELRQNHNTQKAKVACVLHSDPIKLALAHYAGIPLDLYQRLIIEPASVSILAITDNQIHIVRVNDTTATNAPSAG
jgi:probable phosphoglycerate mutase